MPQPYNPEDWVDATRAPMRGQPRRPMAALPEVGGGRPGGGAGGNGGGRGRPYNPADWEDAPRTSAGAAAAYGALQGVTLGWADEIAAAAKAAISDMTYQEARNRMREMGRIAREEHPWAYGASEIAGGLVGPASLAKKLMPKASMAKQAAALGGVAGLGYSEAELRPSAATPASVGQALGETAAGALVSAGTTKLIDRVARGARDRIASRAMDDITSGATKTLRDRLVGEVGRDREKVMQLLREHKDLAREAVKARPQKAFYKAEQILEEMKGRRNAAYDALENAGVDVDVANVTGWLANKAAAMSAKAGPKERIGERIFSLAQQIEEKHPTGRMSLRSLRELATDLGEAAWAGDPGLPVTKVDKKVSQEIVTNLVRILHDSIETAPQLAGRGKEASAFLRNLNKDFQKMINIKEALHDRATREATGSTRWKQTLARHALSEDIFNRDLPKAGAKIIWGEVARPVQNAIDLSLARLMEAAPRSTLPELTRLALGLGLSATVARQAYEWARRASAEEPPSRAAGFDRW